MSLKGFWLNLLVVCPCIAALSSSKASSNFTYSSLRKTKQLYNLIIGPIAVLAAMLVVRPC